jgi:pilus assembly protein FimV
MHRHIVTQTVSRVILGALLALVPLVGFPLGLGKLQVKSALNEPLNAEIDITAIADHELKGLNVSLAPRADFEAAGAERLPLLSQIKFIVAKRPDGRHYLQLKTDGPIEEPFLHVLLQLEWPGGRLVREYTALIDPPSYIAGKPPVTEAPQTAVPTPIPPAEPDTKFVETVPPPGSEAEKAPAQAAAPATPVEPMAAAPAQPQPAEPTPLPEPAPTQEQAPQQVAIAPTEQPVEQPMAQTPTAPLPAATGPAGLSSATEYTVRPGDTLWSIAERMRADNKQLTVEQVILAIFRNNKDAFFRDNVNNLRAGKVLKFPEREALNVPPRNEALREFRAQYDAWQEYKLKLAGGSRTLTVADSKPPESKPAPAADTAKKADAPAEKSAQAKQSPQELLRVVRGTNDADKAAPAKSAETESAKDVETRERTALAERVTTLEESLQSKQLENRELSEKVGQVRSQIKNEKRLIELENQALAQQTAKPAPEPKPAAAPKPEVPAEKPAAASTEAKAPETKTPDAAPVAPVKAAPKRPPLPAPPPPAEKGFLASIYDDVIGDAGDVLLPVVGGIVALAGGLIMIVYMRRRRRSIAEFEESILASDAVPSEATAPTGTADNTTGQVTTGDTSFLSDFSKSGMGQVHTDEVDPIAEAEVYLAYGRDETAEEILKEAIVKNPDRHELKQKLLEIYHQRNDATAFETLAEELYAALGGRGGKVWEKVEEMGRKLNPENPMFRGGAPGRRAADKGERPVAQGMQSVSLSSAPAVAAGAGGGMIAATQATQIVESSSSVDFDFDAVTRPSSTATASESTGALDFDLHAASASDDIAIDEKPTARQASAELSELESIDFGSTGENVDFDSGKLDAAVAEASAPVEAVAVADEEIKWEMDAPVAAAAAAELSDAAPGGNGVDGQWDETATKLDLAKAYIDMGDAEGARSILDEVLAEGNEQQKKQAAELAAQIG